MKGRNADLFGTGVGWASDIGTIYILFDMNSRLLWVRKAWAWVFQGVVKLGESGGGRRLLDMWRDSVSNRSASQSKMLKAMRRNHRLDKGRGLYNTSFIGLEIIHGLPTNYVELNEDERQGRTRRKGRTIQDDTRY
jgi:hypothetical protein